MQYSPVRVRFFSDLTHAGGIMKNVMFVIA